ncbi:MAG: biotin/lipoyl-binding protein, partial [Acidobacteria bacterium]|nr:biotin/lipoyl-binding protein [Acidobacteriota bacterium]
MDGGAGSFRVTVDGVARIVEVTEAGGTRMSLLVGNSSEAGHPAARRSVDALVIETGAAGELTLTVANATFEARVFGKGRTWGARRRVAGSEAGATGMQEIRAPMPGRIARVLVAPGERVKTRQPLVVVEAMKMENELRAAA